MGQELAGGGEKSTPGGPKKEAPGIKFRPPGVKFRPPESSKWASGLLLGRLGRQVGLWRTLWAAKGELENCMEGSWDRLGAFLARLGPGLGRFPPPGEGRGGSRRSFLNFLGDVQAERQKLNLFQI